MEAKKAAKANLESKRSLFLEIGMVAALASALVAFNVKSFSISSGELIPHDNAFVVDDMPPINTMEKVLPPPPKPDPILTDFKEIANDKEPVKEIGPIDFGDDANRRMDEYVPPVIEDEPEVDEPDFFVVVEESPSYPGGEEALYKFLSENIKYPSSALESGIEGKVYIKFIVEKDGSITNVRSVRDIGGGCAAEAMRVVKLMPHWNPGKQRNRPVRTEFTLPVNFSIR